MFYSIIHLFSIFVHNFFFVSYCDGHTHTLVKCLVFLCAIELPQPQRGEMEKHDACIWMLTTERTLCLLVHARSKMHHRGWMNTDWYSGMPSTQHRVMIGGIVHCTTARTHTHTFRAHSPKNVPKLSKYAVHDMHKYEVSINVCAYNAISHIKLLNKRFYWLPSVCA